METARYSRSIIIVHRDSDILPPLKVMGVLLHSTLSPSSSVAIGAGFGTFLLSSRSQSIFALPFWAYQCCPCIHPCLHAIGICSHSASFGRMREHSLLWISCHSASRLGMSHSTLDSPFQDVFQIYARPISSYHRRILYTFRIHPTIGNRWFSAMHFCKALCSSNQKAYVQQAMDTTSAFS